MVICNFYIVDLVSVLADLNRKDMKIKEEIDFVTACILSMWEL